jgi:CMP-N,N'-diacetyllegionaminic acid synthase
MGGDRAQGNSMSTIATICARGGSKGLPRKNVLPFAGLPLIAHSIRQALACPGIDGVYVSTDDDEIAQVAREHGAQVPLRRPAELATDGAGKLPAIEHLVAHLESLGQRIDWVVDLQPTSPLRASQDLQAALALRGRAGLVVSVTQPSHNPYYTLVEASAQGGLQLCKTPAGGAAVARQAVPEVWGLNGAIYVWRRDALAKAVQAGFWSVDMHPLVMPRERSVDIDDRLDFDMAQWLFTRQQQGTQSS